MSLDVSLYSPTEDHICGSCNGTGRRSYDELLFDANITHNLNSMAEAAGIYQALWRPEEIGATKAGDIIELLNDGLLKLQSEPAKYKELNPPNGWGDYEGLVRFVKRYLAACIRHPHAEIRVSR